MIILYVRISPKTLLTFCTHGVLLRTLMTGDASLKTVTHVILVSIITSSTLYRFNFLLWCDVCISVLFTFYFVVSNLFLFIQDDVDDRDDMTDFLLTKMRTMLQKIPTLKLILSSAAVNVDLLRQYFGTCQVLNGR